MRGWGEIFNLQTICMTISSAAAKNSVPDFQSIMLPMLRIFSDGKSHTLKETITAISDHFGLTEEQRNQLLLSGKQRIIDNRVGWARTYLLKAGLISSPQRATFFITDEGRKILTSNPDKINISFLKKLPSFIEWQNSYKTDNYNEETEEFDEIEIDETPLELLEYSFSKIQEELAFELLNKVKSCTPVFFEKLVVDLLIKMGYGGSRADAGQVLGKSGDGGIDGMIKEDKLGLDVIYVQAKKWENQVPISSVRDFAGSLLSKKAKKGIFITTSTYPQSAYDYVNSIEHKIILIEGSQLAKLMIEHNVGVGLKDIYEVKRLDLDYFEE